MPAATPNRREAEAAIIARARTDAAFREVLLKNPKAVIESELGAALPQGLQFIVVEETAATSYLVLPAATDGELSEAELESVSGGTGRIIERFDQSAKNVIQSMRG